MSEEFTSHPSWMHILSPKQYELVIRGYEKLKHKDPNPCWVDCLIAGEESDEQNQKQTIQETDT